MSNAGKSRRAEEQFTESQRRTMLWLVDNDYGIEAVMERYGLTELAAEQYIDSERAKVRAKERAGINWAARWQAAREVG